MKLAYLGVLLQRLGYRIWLWATTVAAWFTAIKYARCVITGDLAWATAIAFTTIVLWFGLDYFQRAARTADFYVDLICSKAAEEKPEASDGS